MSEHQHKEVAPKKHEVTRNGVTIELQNYKIIKGDNKDKEYPAPTFKAETFDRDIAWMGKDTILSIIQSYVKRSAQVLWIENINPETGTVDVAKFLAELAEFTSASKKLAELKDEYDELVAKQGGLVDSLGDDPTPEQLKAIREISTSIKVVKAQIDTKSRKNKPEVKDEAAVETDSV